MEVKFPSNEKWVSANKDIPVYDLDEYQTKVAHLLEAEVEPIFPANLKLLPVDGD